MSGQTHEEEAAIEAKAQSLLPRCAQRDEAAWTELKNLLTPVIRDAIRHKSSRGLLSRLANEEIELGVWEKLVERLPTLPNTDPPQTLLRWARNAVQTSVHEYWAQQADKFGRRVEAELELIADPHRDSADVSESIAVELLAAVRHLLPQPATEALEQFGRGGISLDETVKTLRRLPKRNPKPQLAPPPPKAAAVVAPLKAEELARQIVALDAVYPPPDVAEIAADARWFQAQWEAGALDPYRGSHVVVYDGKVVGSGENSLQLELDFARKLGVHPQRFIIEYIPRRGEF